MRIDAPPDDPLLSVESEMVCVAVSVCAASVRAAVKLVEGSVIVTLAAGAIVTVAVVAVVGAASVTTPLVAPFRLLVVKAPVLAVVPPMAPGVVSAVAMSAVAIAR